ncbi:MAG TPA: GPW/gp25 family protein [Blastocatellia bacterium]|nr:GPW/gp25 family protein [Blastocatellia bacterium]
MDTTGIGFPFVINELGQVAAMTADDNIRAKILQVLLTSPGERVMRPEFGTGLRDLVFDPNNDVLAATTEFTAARALQQWLNDEVVVQSVDVTNDEGALQVEVVYIRRDLVQPGKIKIAF